ncbi:MAG TPA: hypothetical protein VGH28_32775 [Polyangiaceae bacterium]|jgi:hypothetical protein
MRARRICAVFAIAAACGGTRHPAPASVPAETASTVPAPPPLPHDRAEKLVASSTACLADQLWNDAEGDAATAAQRSETSRLCAEVVRAVTGQEDPGQIEALRMLEPSVTEPLVNKVKDLAAADGLDATQSTALERFASNVIAAARETANAGRAAAKLRADIEKLASDRQKRAARERVAARLTATEAAAAASLRSASALETLLRMPDDQAARGSRATGLVFALARVRAAHDLPRHMMLYVAGPPLAAVFGVPTPPLPDRASDRVKPGAWLAYATSVAKACGHPFPSTTPPAEREHAAWTGILAGLADRLEAEAPDVKSPALAALTTAAAARAKNPEKN